MCIKYIQRFNDANYFGKLGLHVGTCGLQVGASTGHGVQPASIFLSTFSSAVNSVKHSNIFFTFFLVTL